MSNSKIAPGKSAQQLIADSQERTCTAYKFIEVDRQLIGNSGNTSGLTASCSSGDRQNWSEVQIAQCDIQTRIDQAAAVTGILGLIQDNSSAISQQAISGQFRNSTSSALPIATVTVRVSQFPAPSATSHVVDFTQDGAIVDAGLNDLIVVRLAHDNRVSPRFLISPATGVLQTVQGQASTCRPVA